jgi:Ca-activated chloride channel family protein
VDEVVLTFHAADENGLPVNDVKQGEVKIWDNGVPPRRIVAFSSVLDRPIRAQILIDTSESMARALPRVKQIATIFAQRMFRQATDRAQVVEFAYASAVSQPWTSNPQSVQRSIAGLSQGAMNPVPGTAIFNAIFQACYYGFRKVDPTATGNVILLFTDGEDTTGKVTIEEALRACQHGNVAIYAFRVRSSTTMNSTDPKTLAELASQTGGRVFQEDDSDNAIGSDLHAIESEMRNEYRLVYDPADFKHDGAFHEIEIQPPDRVSRVEVRSGYYAPTQ